jgi:hypothetical protein
MIQASPDQSAQRGRLIKLSQWVPWFVRSPFYWAIRKNPVWFRRSVGTVTVTAVGMFGEGAGWGLGFLPMHTLGVTIGGIAERPALANGQLVNPDQRFKELVESGYGMVDET